MTKSPHWGGLTVIIARERDLLHFVLSYTLSVSLARVWPAKWHLISNYWVNQVAISLLWVALTVLNNFSEKSGGKTEENGDRSKTPVSEKSSRSSSPAQSTKSSSSAPSTPQDNKAVTFPPPKVTGDSVRGKCREMIVNSLKVEVEFDQGRWFCMLICWMGQIIF